MEKIPKYVKGNILPAENLNFLEITSFVAPPIASIPMFVKTQICQYYKTEEKGKGTFNDF